MITTYQKRRYTTPSIKSLFHDTANKNIHPSRRYLKALAKFNTNFNNNLIHNYSDYTPSPEEQNILTLGLGYSLPPSTQLNSTEIQNNLNSFKNTMYTKHFFHNNISPNTKHPFQGKSNWQAPNPNDNTINQFFTEVTDSISNTQHSHNIPLTTKHLQL